MEEEASSNKIMTRSKKKQPIARPRTTEEKTSSDEKEGKRKSIIDFILGKSKKNTLKLKNAMPFAAGGNIVHDEEAKENYEEMLMEKVLTGKKICSLCSHIRPPATCLCLQKPDLIRHIIDKAITVGRIDPSLRQLKMGKYITPENEDKFERMYLKEQEGEARLREERDRETDEHSTGSQTSINNMNVDEHFMEERPQQCCDAHRSEEIYGQNLWKINRIVVLFTSRKRVLCLPPKKG